MDEHLKTARLCENGMLAFHTFFFFFFFILIVKAERSLSIEGYKFKFIKLLSLFI